MEVKSDPVDNLVTFTAQMPTRMTKNWQCNLQVRKTGLTSQFAAPKCYEVSDKLEKKILRQIRGSKKTNVKLGIGPRNLKCEWRKEI